MSFSPKDFPKTSPSLSLYSQIFALMFPMTHTDTNYCEREPGFYMYQKVTANLPSVEGIITKQIYFNSGVYYMTKLD